MSVQQAPPVPEDPDGWVRRQLERRRRRFELSPEQRRTAAALVSALDRSPRGDERR